MGALPPEAWTALALSVRVAFWATVICLPFGIFVSYALARWQFRGKAFLNVLVYVPLVLPPVVTGYLLLLVFGRNGPIGRILEEVFGLVLAFRWTGAVLAAAIMAFPLMVRALRSAFEAIDPDLEEVAGSLGAGRWRVFFTISLPLALPGVLAGSVLSFAKAMGEFGATITFVSNIPGETQTVPSAIYEFLQIPGAEPAVVGLAVLSLLVAFGALGLSEWLAPRVAKRVAGR
ncbi:molybdate ABC transporter permease subunit [Algirhabdus cladophorae]|uniref:molybdate ABC transporter permease subunit n=1 Tax=Algirhabdus cladophorae TaxID=3377108 RepID=UPI003B84B2E9